MKILYKNILIRDAKENDATILTKWWNDGKIMAHAGFPEGINTTVQKVKHQLQEKMILFLFVNFAISKKNQIPLHCNY